MKTVLVLAIATLTAGIALAAGDETISPKYEAEVRAGVPWITHGKAPAQAEASRYDGDFVLPAELDERLQSWDHIVGHSGKDVYNNLCQACHMADGKGARGAGDYPSLVDNPRLAAPQYPIHVIVSGLGGMPAFGGMLTDTQIADVTNYLMSELNSHSADATEKMVAEERQ